MLCWRLLSTFQSEEPTHEALVLSQERTNLQLLVLISGFPLLLMMIFLWMTLGLQLEHLVLKTVLVDGSVVMQRNLAEPH